MYSRKTISIGMGSLMVIALAIVTVTQAGPESGGPDNSGHLQERVAELEAIVSDLVEENAALRSALAAEEAARSESDNALQAQLDGLSDSGLEERVTNLESKTACLSDSSSQFDVFFEGCNVHVRNTSGRTDTIDGFGNLIIGYNEDAWPPIETGRNDRTGSHNLVVGPYHTYSSYGGFVAGSDNSVTDAHATVSGGRVNTASGLNSSVTGGAGNKASGETASITGGIHNKASGDYSLVAGGGGRSSAAGNEAFARYSAILGGSANITGDPDLEDPDVGESASISGGSVGRASGSLSSISGGFNNVASGEHASATGGYKNVAAADQSSVSGGFENLASGLRSSVSGGYANEARADRSSVSGGSENVASAFSASVSGGSNNVASGSESSVTGGAENEAARQHATVSGGFRNTASWIKSSVSGGQDNIASGLTSSVSGGFENEASGRRSTVSGGRGRSATGAEDWAAGELLEDN